MQTVWTRELVAAVVRNMPYISMMVKVWMTSSKDGMQVTLMADAWIDFMKMMACPGMTIMDGVAEFTLKQTCVLLTAQKELDGTMTGDQSKQTLIMMEQMPDKLVASVVEDMITHNTMKFQECCYDDWIITSLAQDIQILLGERL